MTEPRTKAGKALLASWVRLHRLHTVDDCDPHDAILAIEAEALMLEVELHHPQPVLREALEAIEQLSRDNPYHIPPNENLRIWMRDINERARAALSHPTSSPEDKE